MHSQRTFLQHLRPLQGILTAYARRTLFDPSEAEDVLQDAIRIAYGKFDRYAEGTSFKAWIFKILTFHILNANRRHERAARMEIPLLAHHADLAAALENEWEYDRLLADLDAVFDRLDPAIAQAVQRLPPMERSTLLLRSVAGLSYREAAGVLDVPIGSVMGYLSRARAKLRRDLAAYASERGILPPLREKP